MCNKSVTSVLQECHTVVTRVRCKCVTKVLHKYYKSRASQDSITRAPQLPPPLKDVRRIILGLGLADAFNLSDA
jgi:hypothetical protein